MTKPIPSALSRDERVELDNLMQAAAVSAAIASRHMLDVVKICDHAELRRLQQQCEQLEFNINASTVGLDRLGSWP